MTIDIHNLKCCALSEAPYRFRFDQSTRYWSHSDDGDSSKSWMVHETIESETGEQTCPDCEGFGGDEDDGECPACGDEGTIDLDYGDPSAWDPAIHLAYPIPHLELPGDWRCRLVNMTVVTVFEEPHLALTGGGMDMRWAIAETYINLGYYPPADVCKLPAMAGRGESESDQLILKACFIALEKMRQRTQWQLDSLNDQYAISWSREDYEQRGEIEA